MSHIEGSLKPEKSFWLQNALPWRRDASGKLQPNVDNKNTIRGYGTHAKSAMKVFKLVGVITLIVSTILVMRGGSASSIAATKKVMARCTIIQATVGVTMILPTVIQVADNSLKFKKTYYATCDEDGKIQGKDKRIKSAALIQDGAALGHSLSHVVHGIFLAIGVAALVNGGSVGNADIVITLAPISKLAVKGFGGVKSVAARANGKEVDKNFHTRNLSDLALGLELFLCVMKVSNVALPNVVSLAMLSVIAAQGGWSIFKDIDDGIQKQRAHESLVTRIKASEVPSVRALLPAE